MMKPLVSILIPAYNAAEWIEETILSALAQTCKNIEIIICLFEKYSLFLKYVEMLKMRKTGKRAFLKPVSKTLVK